MQARIHITLKNGVLDPQGKAIGHALSGLGFTGVEDVRQGKYLELQLADQERGAAEHQLRQMCEQLLANTVIESYAIELDGKPVA